jgi:K+-transporting ATPase KdpF subunit
LPGAFSSSPFSTPISANASDPMETIVVGLIALALLAYLFTAMIWPEKF